MSLPTEQENPTTRLHNAATAHSLLLLKPGMSAEAILTRYLYPDAAKNTYYATPSDGDDFMRCYQVLKLLTLRPELMRGASPRWDMLVEAWPELEACYLSGEAELLTGKLLALFPA